FALNGGESTTAGVHHYTDAIMVGLGDLEVSHFDRFAAGSYGELGKAIHAPGCLEIHEVSRNEVVHFACDLHIEITGVKALNRGNARSSFRQACPEGIYSDAQGAYSAHSSHDYSRHLAFPFHIRTLYRIRDLLTVE